MTRETETGETETGETETEETETEETELEAANAESVASGSNPTDEPSESSNRREVVVPERLYRTVTVFSTLIAIVGVVLGFVLLDAATKQASVPIEQVNPWLAALGILAILGGGATYAYASRFRAEGMRKDKDAADEPSNNG